MIFTTAVAFFPRLTARLSRRIAFLPFGLSLSRRVWPARIGLLRRLSLTLARFAAACAFVPPAVLMEPVAVTVPSSLEETLTVIGSPAFGEPAGAAAPTGG